jgi:hypothetical protein
VLFRSTAQAIAEVREHLDGAVGAPGDEGR